MVLKERLWYTNDKEKVVKDGNDEAAFLFGAPNQTIPDALAKKFNIVDGLLMEEKKDAIKEIENKKVKQPENKNGSQPENKKGDK